MNLFVYGMIMGALATAFMSLFELIPYSRYGLTGVFEWHENQAILLRFGVNSSLGIMLLHFLNGSLAAIPYPFVFSLLKPEPYQRLVLSALYGIIVWIVTLFPIHKPLTGLDPIKHPLGPYPAILSLAGHVIYGTSLGVFSLWLG